MKVKKRRIESYKGKEDLRKEEKTAKGKERKI